MGLKGITGQYSLAYGGYYGQDKHEGSIDDKKKQIWYAHNGKPG